MLNAHIYGFSAVTSIITFQMVLFKTNILSNLKIITQSEYFRVIYYFAFFLLEFVKD